MQPKCMGSTQGNTQNREKNIIKKIQNCHLKLISSIKANESDNVDGLAVSFFVQFKSYRWQNQDNIQAKTKISSKKN